MLDHCCSIGVGLPKDNLEAKFLYLFYCMISFEENFATYKKTKRTDLNCSLLNALTRRKMQTSNCLQTVEKFLGSIS